MAASPLVYPTGDFVPFTKILSSEVNGKFNAIKTLLNVTKLSDTNLQDHGISWIKLTLQAASQVAVTDTLGQLTVTAILPSSNGGLGFSFASTTLNAGLVVQANSVGSALTLDAVPTSPVVRVLAWSYFT
jgi:hypothetical protein